MIVKEIEEVSVFSASSTWKDRLNIYFETKRKLWHNSNINEHCAIGQQGRQLWRTFGGRKCVLGVLALWPSGSSMPAPHYSAFGMSEISDIAPWNIYSYLELSTCRMTWLKDSATYATFISVTRLSISKSPS